MRRGYSRLVNVEERRNLKKAGFFVFLSVVILGLLFFFGIPVLGRFAAFISDLGKGNKSIAVNDKTPPAPPRFSTFSDFTNQDKIELKGNSEAGATIKLVFNQDEIETISDKDGQFTFSVNLMGGDNTFSATAKDTAGNVGQSTEIYKIVFDNKAPDLTIDNPADGSQFIGSKQRQVTIHGTTEAESQVTVNDRVVAVDGEGKFQFTTTLTDGENKFTIKSSDKAGNTTEKGLTLQFVS